MFDLSLPPLHCCIRTEYPRQSPATSPRHAASHEDLIGMSRLFFFNAAPCHHRLICQLNIKTRSSAFVIKHRLTLSDEQGGTEAVAVPCLGHREAVRRGAVHPRICTSLSKSTNPNSANWTLNFQSLSRAEEEPVPTLRRRSS